ncbi:AAA ATPase (fragment) [Parafrankia sp. Ea1.12]
MIPAAARLPEVPGLVTQHGDFVVHAPRQTGKTTTLRALAQELTASGRYAAVLTSCEPGRPWSDDVSAAERAILRTLQERAADALPAELRPPTWPEAPAGALLSSALAAWSRACPRPVVLVLDEIDALEGRTLISVLSQLRSGATGRPENFPMSVALCGLRDLRDCHPRNRFAIPRVPGTAASGNPNRLGDPSPFNIIVRSLRLGNFTLDEIRELYGQHTSDTGQPFTDGAVERAFELTDGQPWLVNALANEIIVGMAHPDHSRARGEGRGAPHPDPGHSPRLAGRQAQRLPGPRHHRTADHRHPADAAAEERRHPVRPRPRPTRPGPACPPGQPDLQRVDVLPGLK